MYGGVDGELRRCGTGFSEKVVRRLMREEGLEARRRRRRGDPTSASPTKGR